MYQNKQIYKRVTQLSICPLTRSLTDLFLLNNINTEYSDRYYHIQFFLKIMLQQSQFGLFNTQNL